MEISKIWSPEIEFDKLSASESFTPDQTLPALDFLATAEAILNLQANLDLKLVDWACNLLRYCRPARLELNVYLASEAVEEVKFEEITEPLSFLAYRGYFTSNSDNQRVEIALALPETVLADDYLSLWLGEFGSLKLYWSNTDRLPLKEAGVKQALTLAAQNLSAYLLRFTLENKVVALQAAENLRLALLTQADHDLRGPFGSLTLIADMLLEKGLDLPATEVRRLLGRLQRNVQALNGMFDHYLSLPRLAANYRPNLQAVEVVSHLQKLAEIVSPQLERKEQVFKLDLAELKTDPIFVLADEHYFDQIFLNLIYNAHKHTPSQTEIRVRVEPVQAYLQISVIDNGPGLPANLASQLDKLFNSSFSDDLLKLELGLGLPLVKELVAKQQGLVGYYSRPAETVFWIKLRIPE